MGSQIRRANEVKLNEDIGDLFNEWKDLVDQAKVIYIYIYIYGESN